jgi:hypothetical protein
VKRYWLRDIDDRMMISAERYERLSIKDGNGALKE